MKHYKPTTPSRRHMSVVSYRNAFDAERTAKKLDPRLQKRRGQEIPLRPDKPFGTKEAGVKRSYRDIDFKHG